MALTRFGPFARHYFGRQAGLWVPIDQALSSLSNVATAVVVARASSAREFGGFSAAFLAYGLVLMLARACSGDIILMLKVGRGAVPGHGAVSLAIVVAGAASLVLFGGALLLGGVSGRAFAITGVVLIPLMLQDVYRYLCFGASLPRVAAVLDLIWIAVQVALTAVLAAVHELSMTTALSAWGSGAVCSVAVGHLVYRLPLTLRGGREWGAQHRRIISPLLAEYALLRGSAQLALGAGGIFLTLQQFGALRGGFLVFGPLNVLSASVMTLLVPKMVHTRAMPDILRLSCSSAVLLAFASGLLGLTLLLAPMQLGAEILGDTWPATRPLIIPTAVFTAAATAQAGPAAALRALGQVSKSLRARLPLVPVRVVLAVAGAAILSTRGAAWGLAAAECFGLCALIWQLRTAASGGSVR